jgi:toxin FitB
VSGFLLDTNVISELRRQRPHGAVVSWLSAITVQRLFISAATIGEIQSGIEITRGQDTFKAKEIEIWLDSILASYDIIPMDAQTFRIVSKIMVGKSEELYLDAIIAATAMVNQLTVVSRNTRDFRLFDVPVFDPFTSL